MNREVYPWQQKQWEAILKGLSDAHRPQAIILHGPKGLGKMHFAGVLAAKALCESTEPLQWACGTCRGCKLLNAGNHPDLTVVTAAEKNKAIKVESIRHLTEKLQQTPHCQGLKLALIYPAEQMNRTAANALLKTLEEPPGAALLVLVTHQIGKLPATIVSRCQRVHFSVSAEPQTSAWVRAHTPESIDSDLLLRVADYAPLRAIELAQTDYLQLRDTLLSHLLKVREARVNPIAPVLSYTKSDIELLLYALLTLVMDMSRLQLGVQVNYVVNADRVEALTSLGKTLRATYLQNYVQKIQKAYELFMNGIHINIQLLLETLFLEWSELRPAQKGAAC